MRQFQLQRLPWSSSQLLVQLLRQDAEPQLLAGGWESASARRLFQAAQRSVPVPSEGCRSAHGLGSSDGAVDDGSTSGMDGPPAAPEPNRGSGSRLVAPSALPDGVGLLWLAVVVGPCTIGTPEGVGSTSSSVGGSRNRWASDEAGPAGVVDRLFAAGALTLESASLWLGAALDVGCRAPISEVLEAAVSFFLFLVPPRRPCLLDGWRPCGSQISLASSFLK